jgi:hypothetical protein
MQMLAFRHFLFGFEYSLSVIFGFLCKIGRLIAFFWIYYGAGGMKIVVAFLLKVQYNQGRTSDKNWMDFCTIVPDAGRENTACKRSEKPCEEDPSTRFDPSG